MAKERIYAVQDNRTGDIRLVQAENKEYVAKYLIKDAFEIKSANGAATATLMGQGVKLEVANPTPLEVK